MRKMDIRVEAKRERERCRESRLKGDETRETDARNEVKRERED